MRIVSFSLMIVVAAALIMGCGGSKKKEITTESGLVYEDLRVGRGSIPQPWDRVQIHYKGWLREGDNWFTDDKKFASSYDTGEPFEFVVGRGDVVQGWEEGMATMRVGGKRLVGVPPSDLAYDRDGNRPWDVSPFATLIFEIELLAILEDPETITTESGLMYQDFVIGTGDLPSAGDEVQTHYTGWLTDGTKFDSSVDRGTPFEFTLGQGQVIAGWDEGLATMRVGGKRRLTIPPDLAYGDEDRPTIPPNSTLVFEVELLAINP